jgi:tetratricopeptide (TPR) repeat protein
VKRVLLLLACSTILRADPFNPDAPTLDALIEAGHFLRVKSALEPVFQRHPDDAETAWRLSKAEGALGNLESSLKLAELAVAQNPSRSAYHVQLAAACGRMAQTASLLKQLTFAKRAKKELDIGLELEPENLEALYGLALYYYAAPSFIGGDKRKAHEAAETITGLNPVRGFLTKARLANEKKDPVAEEDFYKKAIAADPQFYEARASLAKFYLATDVAAARQTAEEAVALDPSRVEGWKVLAQAYIATQCWDELLALLDRARKEVPDDLSYYYSSAVALDDSGRFLNWAADFINQYRNAPPEGNEPTLAEAEKLAQRINGRLTSPQAAPQIKAGLRQP